jgi:hypothetical protein
MGRHRPTLNEEADLNLTILRKVLTDGASAALAMLLGTATVPALIAQPRTVVLHATVTVSGGVTFTGSYDTRLLGQSCADIAKGGTNPPSGPNRASFYVPIPPPGPGGSYGSVGGGHTFSTDVTAYPYHGPGTYTGSSLTATQMDADTPPNSEDIHIFAFPTGIGTMIVNPDASGSFQFNGLQDPGSVKISGQVVWTCSN